MAGKILGKLRHNITKGNVTLRLYTDVIKLLKRDMVSSVFMCLPLVLLIDVILISGNSGNSEMFISVAMLQVHGTDQQRCEVMRFTLSNVFHCAMTCLQMYGTSQCLAVHFNASGECALCVTDETGCASQIITVDGESDMEFIPSSLPGNLVVMVALYYRTTCHTTENQSLIRCTTVIRQHVSEHFLRKICSCQNIM